MNAKDREASEWPAIMRVIIGSQAHGIADADSDWDFREVFVIPTQRILTSSIYGPPKDAYTNEGSGDDADRAGWEVAKIINMAMHGHPNSVEVFYAPDAPDSGGELSNYHTILANDLRSLVPAIIPMKGFVEGSLGYAHNCIVKLMKGDRRKKWASTYLRSLVVCRDYLEHGEWRVRVDTMDSEDSAMIIAAKNDDISNGEVVNYGDILEREVKVLGQTSTFLTDEPDRELAAKFIHQVRLQFWEWQ